MRKEDLQEITRGIYAKNIYGKILVLTLVIIFIMPFNLLGTILYAILWFLNPLYALAFLLMGDYEQANEAISEWKSIVRWLIWLLKW